MSVQNENESTLPLKKRGKGDMYLYIAIGLICAAVVVLAVIIGVIVSGNGDEESSEPVSSEIPRHSVDVTSQEESSDESSESSIEESSEPVEESSEPEVTDLPVGSAERTQAYEKYIGVEYAIDMTEYEAYVCPENPEDFIYIVNKNNPVAEDYEPEGLVRCSNMRAGRPDYYSFINPTVDVALDAFIKEANIYAAANGQDPVTVSNAYRSISTQTTLYNSYVSREMGNGLSREDAVAAADRYSARPGTSEHHTGLAVDMHNQINTDSSFDGTVMANWLAENAHRFGFILRYPKEKEDVTGFIYESWHFRFVGRTAATEIYEMGENVTLEEYLGVE